ncbi:MAG: membrane-bound O-acyltransferase family protein [Leptospiraceae bacterium]|nr:MAG: membrane-bound O-acyltransferase family protein [Leptospiraceae bacterium]
MLFHSTIFLLLFISIYIFYWFLPVKGKHYLIILTSFLFYLWYSIPFMLMFLFLSILNYYAAIYLLNHKNKNILTLIVGLDLAVLGFFKYFYLFASGIGYLIQNDYLIHIKENLIRDYNIEIILPIAISFYTFQIIAFVVDCYRNTITEKISFRKFIVFILFFPQFVAGPILRASDFIPQIDQPTLEKRKIYIGSLLILQGVFKKVLVADPIGYYTSPVWQNPSHYDAIIYWFLIFAFVVQVYADFSGYTDMARGMAKLLGYEIPENFRGPLLSSSMSELWNRWHITLSSWLRDYIYIPLGGSRRGEFRTYINLFITMSLGGLWHGATWNMLIWGMLMGIYLSIERFLRVHDIKFLPENQFISFIKKGFTLFMFSFIAIFFATPTLNNAIVIIKGMFLLPRGYPLISYETVIVLIIIGLILNYLQYNRTIIERIYHNETLQFRLIVIGLFLITYLLYLYGDMGGAFIYFAF